MKNKKLLLILFILTSASIFGMVNLKKALAVGQACTAEGIKGICRTATTVTVGTTKAVFFCIEPTEADKGQANCNAGEACCVSKSASTSAVKECTAGGGIKGICRTIAMKGVTSCDGSKEIATDGSGCDKSSEECCVSAKEAIELKEAAEQTAKKDCEANGVGGICRNKRPFGISSCSKEEEEGKAPISGCAVFWKDEVCCIPQGSANKCCIISQDPKDYRVSNCKKDMTIGSGESKCSEIKNVNCDALVQCKDPAGTGASATGATGAGGPATTATFDNPIGFTSVSELLSSVLSKLMGIIAIVAIVFIVIGGIMYILSAGNTTMMTRAKNIWTGAVIGLAIALAAPTFLKEIREILGGGQTGGSAEAWVSNALTIKQIALNILKLLLSLVGILGIIALVVGGGMFLTAYGNERQIDKGKALIKYAIIGIAISIAALIIVREVASLLGAPAG